MTAPARPFCARDPAAAAAFDRWAARMEAAGAELNEADLYVVGLLASREAGLERLRAELAAEKELDRRLSLLVAEDRAARAFGAALDRAERVFASRIEARVPLAVAVGERRVLRMVPLPRRGPDGAVEGRIVKALGGGRLTKADLRGRVRGGQSEFLRALKALLADGRVRVSGRGRRGYPRTYGLRGE